MIRVSDLLGKPLLSLTDAQTVGYISNVWFDAGLRRAKTAEITSDDDDFPERAYVEFRALICDGDAAVVKSAVRLDAENSPAAAVPCPINRAGFNQGGKSLGKVRDVFLEGSAVVQIVCETAAFTPKELINLGDNLCIFNDTGKPIKLTKPRVPKSAPRPAEAVQIHSGVQTPRSPQSVTVTRTPGEPTKDYSFLLGKPVHAPVLNDGKVLIPAGTVVNEKTIETARRAGKLVQLALRAY